MRFLRSFICLCSLLTVLGAGTLLAQSGTVHLAQPAAKSGGAHTNGEPPIGSMAIYVLNPGVPGTNATDIVDCNSDNSTVATDANGDCYVQADSSGHFDLTDAYSCGSDTDIIYFEAIGGSIGGGTNNQIALLMVPSSSQNCGYYFNNSGTATVALTEFTDVMAAFGAGVFSSARHPSSHLYDSLGVYNTANDRAAMLAAFDYVNGQVSSSSGYYSGSDTNVARQLNTLADVIASCDESYGGTGAGTRCGTLFSDTTQGAFQTSATSSAPVNTFMASASMAQDPTNNVQTQYYLVAPTAPWQPDDSSTPAYWTVPVAESAQPVINQTATASSATHSTAGVTNTLTIYGTNFLTASGGCPTVIVASYYAAVSSGTSCTATSVTVNVPRFTNKGALGLYVGGIASTFVPFTIN